MLVNCAGISYSGEFDTLTVDQFRVSMNMVLILIACQHAYACRAQYCYGKSVRLSVTLWYCIKTNAHIVKLFSPLVGAWLIFSADWSVLVPMTSRTLKGGIWEVKIFWQIFIIMPNWFDLEWQNLVWSYTWGRSIFLWYQPCCLPKGAGPQCPTKFLGPPTYAKTV